MDMCALCGSSHLKLHTTLKGGYRIFVCRDCTNALTYPKPTAQYDDHPFFAHAKVDESRWRSYSRQLIQFIKQNYGSKGRLLDVGCSHGLLLEEARLAGFDAHGVEPSRSAVQYCQNRGLNVQHGYLEVDSFPSHSFDVVVMSHVIEHVPEPVRLIEIARDILSPQGVLCLCQTNYEGTLPKYFGKYWSYWVQHEHYYHFSLQGIHTLLKAVGLQVVAETLSPLGYHLNFEIKSFRGILSVALNTLQYGINQYQIGWPFKGDQMYILAKPYN